MEFASAWMDLEGITLTEISQTEKDKHYMISYMESKKRKTQNKMKADP